MLIKKPNLFVGKHFHSCLDENKVFCRVCKNFHNPDNSPCKVQIKKPNILSKKFGFVANATQNGSQKSCAMCFDSCEPCLGHLNSGMGPNEKLCNALVYIHEKDQKGNFELNYLSDSDLALEDEGEWIERQYEWPKRNVTTRKQGVNTKGQFTLRNRKCSGVMERFFKKVLLDRKIAHTIFIGQKSFVHQAYKTLLRLRVEMRQPLRRGRDLILLRIKLNNISILNIDSYRSKKVKLNTSMYFPFNLNFKNFYQMRLKKMPDYKFFISTQHDIEMTENYM